MMKLARSRRRALLALAGLAAATYGAPAQAADDKSTISAVMELVGVSSDPNASKIDYNERPKLVLPPRVGDLPAPQETNRPDGWPTDVAAARRRNTDRYAKIPNAPPEEKKPGLLERIRGPKPDYAPGTDDEPGFLQRALSARSRSSGPMTEEPTRRMLTEPPTGYRRPTMDLARVRDSDGGKSSSWWNPLSYLGGEGNESDPVAQTAGTAPAQKPPASSGGLSGMMPSFLRGSDN